MYESPEELKKWDKFKNLSDKTKRNLAPSESFNKSGAINKLYQTQEAVIKRAGNDPAKIREAHRFASALEREAKFIRYSK